MLIDKVDFTKLDFLKSRNYLIGFVAILTMIVGIKASQVSSDFILIHFQNRATPNDMLFELLPYNQAYELIAEFTFYIMVFIFIYYVAKYAIEKLAYYWTVGWAYMIFRAFVNILTPFERPLAPDLLHGVLRYIDPVRITTDFFIPMGMFPSGHLGLATLSYIAVRDVAPKWVHKPMLSLLFLEAISMIASRGHYTIDVIGAIAFVVLIYIWSEKNLKKLLSME